ncbi:MAG: hypothetical protein PHS14_04710 [Elusimicrobia bacterium]|nr:hypothetical protein [Elusimicrobiota bacterium]
MRRGQKRHPALEAAVFAAALLLSAFIARELWRRRSPAQPAPDTAVMRPIELNLTRPPLPLEDSPRRTEAAVTGVAPIKLTRVQRRKPKPAAVPAPR